LRAVTFEGKGNNHGIKIQFGCGKQPVNDIIGKGKDSEASNAIIAAADKPDPRPIYIGVWGGPREVAQAIWDVKNTRSEAETKAFIGNPRAFREDRSRSAAYGRFKRQAAQEPVNSWNTFMLSALLTSS
jgi:hypothetical protein